MVLTRQGRAALPVAEGEIERVKARRKKLEHWAGRLTARHAWIHFEVDHYTPSRYLRMNDVPVSG
jgi:hypothetical protein